VSYLTVASEQPGDVGTRAKAALVELEKLDPETVKTARSLMAFGALGRARGVAAASSTTAANSVKPPAGGERAGVTDAKQGFAASAADDKVDAKSIPDPASYSTGDGAQSEPKAASTDKPTAKTVPTDVKAQAPPVRAGSAAVVAQDAPAAVKAHMNPLLVAGVPLGAAVLLMGIYWLILRVGAV
jgi:hypothetical protein